MSAQPRDRRSRGRHRGTIGKDRDARIPFDSIHEARIARSGYKCRQGGCYSSRLFDGKESSNFATTPRTHGLKEATLGYLILSSLYSRLESWCNMLMRTTQLLCAPQRDSCERDEQRGKRVPNIFRPGDKAPITCIYRVLHGRQHVEGHYVIALQGDIFPACLECSDNVRFDVAVSAAHVNAHSLFKRQPG
jgi:hypothetical protein